MFTQNKEIHEDRVYCECGGNKGAKGHKKDMWRTNDACTKVTNTHTQTRSQKKGNGEIEMMGSVDACMRMMG